VHALRQFVAVPVADRLASALATSERRVVGVMSEAIEAPALRSAATQSSLGRVICIFPPGRFAGSDSAEGAAR